MPNSVEIDLTQLTNENKLVTSIYKICSDINTSDELINNIKRKLDDKDCFKFKEINNDFFNGLVFSYKTTPVWSDAILELIDEVRFQKKKNQMMWEMILKVQMKISQLKDRLKSMILQKKMN